MTTERYNKIIETQIEKCKELLIKKGEEYSAGKDPLHNFKAAAALIGSEHEALAGYMMKHTVSIYDMLKGCAHDYTIEQWEEKITDHINYLLILRAVLDDEMTRVVAPSNNCVFHGEIHTL